MHRKCVGSSSSWTTAARTIRDSASEMFVLVVLFFCAIAPILWKNAVPGQPYLVWLKINFFRAPLSLCPLTDEAGALIKALLESKRAHKCGQPSEPS